MGNSETIIRLEDSAEKFCRKSKNILFKYFAKFLSF